MYPVALTAIGGEEVELRYGLSMDVGCNVLGVARVAVLVPPENGTFKEIERERFPGFDIGNPRRACNRNRVKVTTAVYTANPGFVGTDRFVFVMVFYNGEWATYSVEMTVWR